MKSEPYNPRLKKLLIEVVEKQLRDNDPPVTREALQRLLAAGYTESQAKKKIAAVVIGHSNSWVCRRTSFLGKDA